MRRRAFIAGLGVTAVWPMVAHGQQQAAMPVVGILSSGLADNSAPGLEAFRQGLSEAGYADAKNVVIKYVWGQEKYERMPALAAELVANQVAVIVAFGNVAARAAKEATTTIPVAFLVGSDPVRIGLVKSLNMPATNMTGIHILNTDLETKRLELLMEVVPGADAIAFLVNPDSPTTDVKLRDVRGAATVLGRKLFVLNARTTDDFDAAFAPSAERPGQAVVIASDNMFSSHSKELGQLAARRTTPAIAAYRDFAMAGGLMSYGTSTMEANRQVGLYTGRILKGARPADLPVMQSTQVEFVINLKAAKQLGLSVSLPLLGRADEVIE
jgi:putative ABC transport system substrate-binding protein